MIKKLNTPDIKNLILGSSIYSTGGGLDVSNQEKYFNQIKGSLPNLISVDELDDSDYICTAYGVGPAVADNSENVIDYKKVLTEFGKITGKTIKGIFAGEINIEGLVFDTAAKLNLPVVDGDCCGGRAVPEIQMDTFFAQNISITPALMVNTKGEQLLYSNTEDNFKLEKIARHFAIISKTSVFIIDHLVDVKTAKKALTTGSLSRSLETGAFITESKNQIKLIDLVNQTASKLVFEGTVSNVNLKIVEGFLSGSYSITNLHNSILEIQVKNENMVAIIDNQVVFKSPDSIIVVNSDTFYGLHNSQIKMGDKVAVMIKDCVEGFKSENGKKLFED